MLLLKETLERNSALKFTFETEVQKRMPFLDVLIDRTHNEISLSVYTKPTNYGDCINFTSICPDRYKVGVMKSFLHSTYAISSSWEAFHQDRASIKQLLVNNNFPMAIIDKQVNKFLEKKIKPADVNEANNDNYENIYFQNQMSATYKQEKPNVRKLSRSTLKLQRMMLSWSSLYIRPKKLRKKASS